jgi:hypothetical protein
MPQERVIFKLIEGKNFDKLGLLVDVFEFAFEQSGLSQYDLSQFNTEN